MQKKAAAISLGFFFAILSVLAAFLSAPSAPPEGLGPPVNLFWSFVYGIGWEVAALFADVRAPGPALVGAKLWPLLVFFSVATGFTWAWMKSQSARLRLLQMLLISLCIWLPVKWVAHSPLRHLPNYMATLFVVY